MYAIRQAVQNKDCVIHHVPSYFQLADIMTKSPSKTVFLRLKDEIVKKIIQNLFKTKNTKKIFFTDAQEFEFFEKFLLNFFFCILIVKLKKE